MNAKTLIISVFLLLFLSTTAFAATTIDNQTRTGTVTLQTSQIFELNTVYSPANIVSLNATVMPVYAETGPYDMPATGLLGMWKLDEGTGTTIIDASGNGRNGTAQNGMAWVTGKYNSAGYFDGVNDRIDIPHSTDLNISNLTMIAWVDADNFTAYKTVISKGNSYSSGYKIRMSTDSKVEFYAYGTSDSVLYSTSVVTDGWHMIATTYDNTSKKIYIDGKLDASEPTSGFINNSTGILYIGSWGTNFIYNGTIDNVALYNRSLSDTEVKQVYYDTLRNLQIKTNSNSTYSSQVSSSETVNIPYSSADAAITNLSIYAPETVTISGVTVNNYTSTISPINITSTVGVIVQLPPSTDMKTGFASSWTRSISMVSAIIIVILGGVMLMVVRGGSSEAVTMAVKSIIFILFLLLVGAAVFSSI